MGTQLYGGCPYDFYSDNPPGFPDPGASAGIHFLSTLVTNPKEYHLHGSSTLLFHCAVGYSNRGGIVAMDRCFWLNVTHIFKDAPKNDADLTIVE